jgi:hypothetical protein
MPALSATLTARFELPQEAPPQALARWRAERPSWLAAHYVEVDESYKTITWEWSHTPFSMKLVGGGAFGGHEVFRLTAVFDDDGDGGTHVTVNGTAEEQTREAIRAAADSFVVGGVV